MEKNSSIEGMFYVPHPVLVKIEESYGGLLSSIENEEHIVFDMLGKMKLKENVSLGQLNDVLRACKDQRDVLIRCQSSVVEANSKETNGQRMEALIKLEARIYECMCKLTKASNALYSHGKGQVSVGSWADGVEQMEAKQYPDCEPKFETKAIIYCDALVQNPTEEEAKKWLEEQDVVDVIVKTSCINSGEVTGSNQISLGEELDGRANLSDKMMDGKPLSSHLRFVEKMAVGGGNLYLWEIDDPSQLLLNVPIKHCLEYLNGIDPEYSSYIGTTFIPKEDGEIEEGLVFGFNRLAAIQKCVLDAGYFENASESQEKKES